MPIIARDWLRPEAAAASMRDGNSYDRTMRMIKQDRELEAEAVRERMSELGSKSRRGKWDHCWKTLEEDVASTARENSIPVGLQEIYIARFGDAPSLAAIRLRLLKRANNLRGEI